MHPRAAQFFCINNLTNGCFDQRRPGEIKAASLRHQYFVAQHREIRATGYAIAHDRGELRHACCRNHRIIPKDPAEIIFIRENFILHR